MDSRIIAFSVGILNFPLHFCIDRYVCIDIYRATTNVYLPTYRPWISGRKDTIWLTVPHETMWLTAVSTFIFTVFKAAQPTYAMQQAETDQLRLVNTIFEKYDKTLRPVVNTIDVTNVTLNPALFSIVETNEADESITIVQWFRMTWTDVFIQWNPSDYGGMRELMIPMSRIWYPDIISLNMIHNTKLVSDKKNYAIINYDGSILVSINEVLKMHCRYNIIMFPFDIQNCTMTITSWMHTGAQIDIFFKTPTDLVTYNPNSEWDLISMTGRRKKMGSGAFTTTWFNVYYDIFIQRKPVYYILTFVLPCFMITTINIVGIFSPFNDEGEREEKVTMGLTTLLTMTLIVTLIADKMPKSSEGMPLLVIYVMLQIAIAVFASLMAVIIMYQHLKWTTGNPVPNWILTVTRLNHKKGQDVTHEAGQIASVGIRASKDMVRQQGNVLKDIQSMMWQMVQHFYEHHDREIRQMEWQRAVQRLDLIVMFIFLILNSVLTIGFFVIGYSNLKI